MRESHQSFPGRFAAQPFALQVKLSKRSWWEAMFVGGRTLGEWETMSAGRSFELPLLYLQARSKWEEIDHAQVVAARLWCPNGQIAEVQATGPNRVIQFKVGGMRVDGPWLESHLLGVLTDGEGNCDCWMWQYEERRLRRFADNIFRLHERLKCGPLNLEALDLKL